MTINVHIKGSVLSNDSAEKPQLIKNEQLKTPLNRATHSWRIDCRAFWSESFWRISDAVWLISKNRGFFSRISNVNY
jgi:hypothetical protein